MHKRFVEILCCPETHQPLILNATEVAQNGMVTSGELVGPSGQLYPIVRGVPRFVGEEYYATSFGYEWNRWPRVQFESENIGRPMEGQTTHMWETITGMGDLQGKTLVEFGCGPGRFLDIVHRKGGRAVGIDLSLAVEAARSNFLAEPDVLIVQGDIFKPPFRKGCFDGGFTIGVLHHTPDPLRGLKALAQTIRAGGRVACSVYPNWGFYSSRSVARHRRLNNRLRPLFGYNVALVYTFLSAYLLAPFFARCMGLRGINRLIQYLEANWLPCLYALPDSRWRLLDVFDAITPAIASTHTTEEVRTWMEQAGCENIRTTTWGETSFIGNKM